MNYGQFCPIAKATEILGERWTILIVRELLMGGRRFTDLQSGLGDISPALLTTRLRSLEQQGLVSRRRISGQRGYEYFPTAACEALLPIVVSLGEWGLTWARHMLNDDDFDIDFLMFYLGRSVDPERLPGGATVIQFKFTDLKEQRDWWLLIEGEDVQICINRPSRDVDVFFTTTVRTMHDVWMGDRTYREAIDADDLVIEGEPALTRNVSRWLRPSVFVSAPRSPVPPSLLAS
ncbi:winged helix-turn-helix transcriptional regulator [Sphingomonas sp. G124]|uniref:Winged helix-turn-helix transcriptional regulator n=1 Tax=Sphingomonas cremea TaxID=2904799 RepID=A0A9X1QNK7_9SPHN|nr:winged helix-turn-helix transcriptional regulator [Sphingomonas cremea]MCF2514624.1 winged helix-turn-helix transcriptional regulator [Sphingomonas cremea]